MIFILLTLISVSIATKEDLTSAAEVYTCGTNTARWVCPTENGDGDLVATYCCHESPDTSTDTECQDVDLCKQGDDSSSEGLVYPYDGSTGTATITSGDGGCAFEDDDRFDCDNFSGNIDEN